MPLRELSSVIVFVIVVALGYAPSRGQSNLTGAFYNKPVELRLERSIRKSFAVVLMKVMRGWESPPHSGDVQIVGASLDDGFKKF